MKRMIIALVLLLGCLGAAIFEMNFIKESADSFLQEIEELDGDMRRGDTGQASVRSYKLERDWGNWVQTVDILLIHDYVDSVSSSLANSSSIISQSEPEAQASKPGAVPPRASMPSSGPNIGGNSTPGTIPISRPSVNVTDPFDDQGLE
jgi:hypothetical protein